MVLERSSLARPGEYGVVRSASSRLVLPFMQKRCGGVIASTSLIVPTGCVALRELDGRKTNDASPKDVRSSPEGIVRPSLELPAASPTNLDNWDA